MRKIQLRQRPNIRGVGEQKTVAPVVEATPEVVEEETTKTTFETIKKAVNKITKKKASK